MSMENIVKCLLRLADVADELTKLFVAAALLLFVYYLVMGKWNEPTLEANALLHNER